jgi:uncharacterized protein UPF0547
MQIAAFAVACFAAGLALLSLAWQVYSWRRERRFAMAVRIRSEGVALGGGRYPVTVVATNEGGTTEWVEQIALKATYERELNRRITFNSPELVRNPSINRELRPRNRFESEFNLLSAQIGGGGLPISIVAVASFASGRETCSQIFKPDPKQARAAHEPDPVADLNAQLADFPTGWYEDYFPTGPFAVCPDCKTEIPVDARVCRYCGHRTEDPPDEI